MSVDEQSATIAFLGTGAAFGEPGAEVTRLDTHISHVFLVGARAFKLKRAVAFSYLDFSTAALRRRYCEAELNLGRRMAPTLYRAVHAVTRDRTGRLALDGDGTAVDWLIEMRRFDQEALFDRMAARGALTPALMDALADEIAAFHAGAEPAPQFGGPEGVRAVIGGIVNNLRRAQIFDAAAVARVAREFEDAVASNDALLASRNRAGKVRRCHGDLHLRNICLVDGQPTLFDPVEFSDAISSIDVLYDLAFLLMDLVHEGHGELANQVFNRYLDRGDEEDGLILLPLFLAMRAAIRAHVSASANDPERARGYFALAQLLMRPEKPCLVAIGGVSGTGKTTLARAIAPGLGRAPGARILRSDVVRKLLFGVAPETRLPPSAYDQETSRRVYEMLYGRAAAVLEAGQAAIVDAACLRAEERQAIAAVARAAGTNFTGLWLEAPRAVLERRLTARRGDASDADVAVLRTQLAYDFGPIDWRRLDASDDPAAAAREAIGAN